MLERFTYTNNFGDTLDFGKSPFYVNENDLRDFAWNITSKNNKISGFKKGVVQKTIPVIINCSSEMDGYEKRNQLFEVFEKDVLAKKHGKIHIGDYYLRCYITGSKKTEYLIHKNYMVVSLTVQTDLPEWIYEKTTTHQMGVVSGQDYLDFNYDFDYDFMNELSNATINNSSFVASNFILTIEGEVINPTLVIDDHKYAVNVVVGERERLVIDSSKKTIILVKSNGEEINCFNDRHKDSYIFEKIPVGEHEVTSTNESMLFHITLLDERSEPKWT